MSLESVGATEALPRIRCILASGGGTLDLHIQMALSKEMSDKGRIFVLHGATVNDTRLRLVVVLGLAMTAVNAYGLWYVSI